MSTEKPADLYRKCWARSLGNCAGPMSREHIFSRAVHRDEPGKTRGVMGMANMPDQDIGPEPLSARILCRKHNADLSLLDSEAKKLADALHAFHDGAPHTTVHLQGPLIERWALKTVINHMAAGLGHSDKWEAGEDVVRVAFGIDEFPPRLGLYNLRLDDYEPISPEQTIITPAWTGVGGIPTDFMGAVVYMHGAAFFLALGERFLDLIAAGRLLNLGTFALPADGLVYRPPLAQIRDDRGHAATALFDWPR